MKYIQLILSLPTENATVRQRAWRALKVSGAAVLRDGVYLMPERETCVHFFQEIAAEVVAGGGLAYVMRIEAADDADYIQFFDRTAEYSALLADVVQARTFLTVDTVAETLKQARKLRKTFTKLVEIDFFPDEQQRQADSILNELELACSRLLSPDEPQAIRGEIKRLNPNDYQGRVWATRQRPWVDRLASAWLIHRFIDLGAQFLWLASPNDIPNHALGFDFDGATFSHVGNRVTFEVLVESFGLEQPAIARLGRLIHYLDVGGIQPPEATGVETILAGLRSAITDDDTLFANANAVFNGLFTQFKQETSPPIQSQPMETPLEP